MTPLQRASITGFAARHDRVVSLVCHFVSSRLWDKRSSPSKDHPLSRSGCQSETASQRGIRRTGAKGSPADFNPQLRCRPFTQDSSPEPSVGASDMNRLDDQLLVLRETTLVLILDIDL
ncbi:hypothetical protein [Sinomonas terrae]|uniref:Uncharacterized protein n=1 Tax=Sinomonas terrae TaxID=2908838 RepID=A0ABS9U1X5_9MICC|nr:hypothetical protein [Sinomonas terrae]MCH6470706.1 hypothetical protein [Sinomonas terrae]